VDEHARRRAGHRPIRRLLAARRRDRRRLRRGATFALQDEPRGTGDAVRAALAVLPHDASEVLVLSGDVPLVTGADLDAVLEARRRGRRRRSRSRACSPRIPASSGGSSAGEFGTVERIVEAEGRDARGARRQRDERGIYAFDAGWLRRRIEALTPSTATGELYLTDLVRLAREDGRIVSAVAFDDDGRFDGINDRSQLAAAEWTMRVRLNEAHMRNGVTMRDPSTVYLDWSVDLGLDVVLEPNVVLRGATSVGDGAVIGAGSQLIDATVGRARQVWASVVESSTIEDEAIVGPVQPPSARARSSAAAPRSATSPSSRTPTLGARSKQHHMSYLGDATVGDGVNIGAGAITANYDGSASTRRRSTTVRSSASTR
jgi:bifunctional UDP-N-acetylglucosamine pyrophosphorylase/glucosamine-1-phosphate N-acetyltransferase